MDDKKNAPQTPPYVAYKTFKNFLRSLQVTIPSRIDKSVMPSTSGAAQGQILQALKYFKLIDPITGAPQPNLARLVKSEGAEHQKVMRELLEANYPFLRDKHIDLTVATHRLLEDQFKDSAQGDTLRKCVTFFIPAAAEAGIALSPFIKALGTRTSSGKPRKARTSKGTNGNQGDNEKEQRQSQHDRYTLLPTDD